jgi:bifunctional DNA-binding transcriptional regulator/antitoxin component of YhaV-PrlF toxin-antitoxin module
MGESAGVVKMSDSGMMTIPVEVRELLGIKNTEALLRVNNIEIADIVDDDSDVEEITESGSESAGIVRMAPDGVLILPVEVRKVLGVEDKAAFVRVNDIEVAKIIDDDDGGES